MKVKTNLKNISRGFTLIELLVVIAIIGILSSVVLASLNSARARGADAAVKGNLFQVKAQAEIYYDDFSTYGASAADCTAGVFSDARITQVITTATALLDPPAAITCNTSADGLLWAMSANQLKSAGTSWCIDNTGTSVEGETAQDGICQP